MSKPRAGPKSARVQKAKEQKVSGTPGARGGRPSALEDEKTLALVLDAAMLGMNASNAAQYARLSPGTVSHWLNLGEARISEGVDAEDDRYVEFTLSWRQAKMQGRASVFRIMMEHKNPTALKEWLTRTDDEMEYLDRDKVYQVNNRGPLVQINDNRQDNRTQVIQSGIERAKQQLKEEQSRLGAAPARVIEMEREDGPEDSPAEKIRSLRGNRAG